MILIKGLERLYFATIDRSNFREPASRIAVFLLPVLFWGREISWWCLPVGAAGLLMRAWAAGVLQKDSEIAKVGPYRFMRHPLYFGSCLLALAVIVALHHWAVTLVFGGLTLLTYRHRLTYEDKQLVAHFGAPYEKYMEEVSAFWPRKGFFSAIAGGILHPSFSFRQYLKNKEFECLLGVAAVYLFFFVSSLYSK